MTSRFLVPSIDLVPGAPPHFAALFDDTDPHHINCGSDASLDDLPAAGEITIEAVIYSYGTTGPAQDIVISKDNRFGTVHGWRMGLVESGDTKAYAIVPLDSGNAFVGYTTITENAWVHLVMHYNAATKTLRMAIDGSWGTADTGAGSYITDASDSLIIGADKYNITYGWTFNGLIAWVRISDSDRYDAAGGTSFTPPAKDAPPEIDANTVEQWNLNEGSGATTAAEVSSPNNDGSLTGITWEAI